MAGIRVWQMCLVDIVIWEAKKWRMERNDIEE